MGDFGFTSAKVVAIVVAGVAMLATLIRLVSAYEDRVAMKAAEERGIPIHPVTVRLVHGSIRREWVRMVKHLVILIILATVPIESSYRDARALGLSLVAVGLMINSIWDHLDQRFALRWRGILPNKHSKPEDE